MENSMNLDRHDNFQGRSEAVLAVTILVCVLATVFVSFRMLSRAAIVKKLSVDDYLIVLAWIVAVGLSFCICYGCAYGLGRHQRHVPDAWQSTLDKANYVFSVLYQPSLMATKTSILAFYLSLPTTNKNFKWACIGTLVVVNAGGLALTLFTVFQCRPISSLFVNPKPETATCTDIVTIYLSSAPLNIITDLAILFLPMPILTAMRLPKKQKVILVVTFGFGVFVAVVDVVRIVYLQSASRYRLDDIQHGRQSSDGNQRDAEQTDFSWYASLSFMWSAIEVNVGIMCACVPGLKPLVSRFMPHLLRDPGEASSKHDSVFSPNGCNEMTEAQRVPSTLPMPMNPDDVHRRVFSVSNQVPRSDENQHSAEGQSAEESEMGMMDFLTTPDMNHFPSAERTQTACTNTSRNTSAATPTFFDFVNMKGKKSLVHLTGRESIFPIAMVSVLFFIWGFEYGLLDVLNQQFQRAANMTSTQGTGIHSAYFCGYFAGPLLVGRLVLKHWGFKACFAIGLSIYACGTLIFWPAAVLTSFPAFLITHFIVAFGLSILEVAANPFIILCGPAEYAESRINISQGFQAIGSVAAPLIANRAFFHQELNAPSLVDTQWAYLGISLFTVLLAVAYYYLPLPEATDDEIEVAAQRIDGANKAKVGKVQVIWITLGFGVLSQFCYVGAQEVNATNYESYMSSSAPYHRKANFLAIAHTAFAVSRFLVAAIVLSVKPRLVLAFFYIGAIVFEVLAMNTHGDTGTAMITMVFFFEGPLFTLIFAQALRGVGRNTKLASVAITMSISGGALFAPIANEIAITRRGPHYALVMAVAALAGGSTMAGWLNFHPAARKQCDPIKDVTRVAAGEDSSTSSRANRVLEFLQFGKRRSKESTGAEWRERRGETKDG